ncbi:Signal transduction histidine kinase [Microlunatus sagamiharensis]|uniref:histidine kinase n=1 Tax=Microlunatus sagamiharensis TaxID=546874 RepID=A0A1H2MGV1_9ACTN|nr:histidine kinase [Microlunatus sagamiharensis]SDU92188.1 Signal transduction histidine kinase [Microlunatus sagamiharensis]
MTVESLRGGEFARVFITIGWVCTAVVGVVTAAVGLPSGRAAATSVVVLTVVGLVSWSATLWTTEEPGWILPCLAVTGVCGAGLDAIHSSGPGYVLCYMAVAAIGLRRRGLAAGLVAGLVGAGLVAAEASVSPEPVSAAVGSGIGVAFVFVATRFAGANRDAALRVQALHAQERATRVAQNEAAVLAERARLARELHDVLAHTLSGLAIQLEAARMLAEHVHADPRLIDHLATSHQLTRDGLVNARRAVVTLRDDTPYGVRQLPSLIELTRRTTHLAITAEESGLPVDLPAELDLVVYRTVQESLTNAAKHAGPDATVDVLLRWTAQVLTVEVRDDGGTVAAPAPEGGHGLAGLRERAGLCGGALQAGPCAGGWRVELTLPLPALRPTSGQAARP